METLRRQIEETEKAVFLQNIHGEDLTPFEELVLENQLVLMKVLFEEYEKKKV
jgi:hypothetical protein